MRIIPAIDILNGKCVRLTKGDYNSRKIYSEQPLEVAKAFEASGIRYLHVVDLDGAKGTGIVNHKILECIATQTNLQIDFGGGIKSDLDLKLAFNSGASQVTVGSIAVSEPDKFGEWLSTYGADKIILGADCRSRMVAFNGWQENSTLDVLDFIIHYQKSGLQQTICTDISRDGALQGPALALYQEILMQTDIGLIASGGISCLQDIIDLEAIGCSAAIIGKAFYEGFITLKELESLC